MKERESRNEAQTFQGLKSTLRSASIVFSSVFFFFPGSLPSSFAACKGQDTESERERERERKRETAKGRRTETNRQIEWEDGMEGRGRGG